MNSRRPATNTPAGKPTLPEGWFYPDDATADGLLAELHRELPRGHLLEDCNVEVFAWRKGATDDVLFRDRDEPHLFTVVHLTWLGRTEINERHPAVEFDGTFEEFVTMERELFGLVAPDGPEA